MTYRVDLTERAARDLRRIYLSIHAEDRAQAHAGSMGLSRRSWALTNSRSIGERNRVVTVLHIRHGARDAFMPGKPDEEA